MTDEAGTRRHALRAGLAALGVLILVIVTVGDTRKEPEGGAPRSGAVADVAEADAAAEAPVAQPTHVPSEPPEPSPTVPLAGGASFVVPWSDAPSEEPQEPSASEGGAAPPRATRAPQPCVEYTWEAADSPAAFGQLLVEIRVRNDCGRVLEALDVMFRADAVHGGDVIYTGQGNVLERLYPGSVRTVMIALPGSAGSFDRVEVAPVNPPVR